MKKFSSNAICGNYNSQIVNGMLNFINTIFNSKLINLNILEDKFRNYSWYIDKTSGNIFNIIVNIDEELLSNNLLDNNKILRQLKSKKYTKVNLKLNKISRNQYLNNSFLYKFSINSSLGREHFSVENFTNNDLTIDFKRKRYDNTSNKERSHEINKRRKSSNSEDYKNLWINMVSASKVRNYLLNDPLIDWLSEYNITNIYDVPKGRISNSMGTIKFNNTDIFTKYIMKQGIIFENEVYKLLKSKFNIVKVAESYEARSTEKYLKTLELMKKGVDMLYQPVVHDFENGIYGSPDLLVRSDKLNSIFNVDYIDKKEERNRSPKLGKNFHYEVIDIKHSTLHLNSNGLTLRNTGSIPAYKGQILIYTMAVGKMQGYQSDKGYILGKKWEYTKLGIKCKGNDFMNRLGVIDFSNNDNEYIDKTLRAIEWIRNVRNHGQNWSLLPFPSRKELYPNMKNEKDGSWRRIKIELDNKINEITSIWNCGVSKRSFAHNRGIYSWKDKKCTPTNLGFKPGKLTESLKPILKINQQNKKLIDIGGLKKDKTWKHNDNDIMEFYLDYETMNSNLGKCEIDENHVGYKDNDFIFMIGVGWGDIKWEFKEFVALSNTTKGELDMINNFWSFINKKLLENNKKSAKFIHWTQAEPRCYLKLKSRHNLALPNKNFYDLYNLFKMNKIVVKNALNYSLKTIAKSMKKNHMIETSWDSNNPCSNGLKAMLLAYKLYEKSEILDMNEPIINDIIHYNEVDCKVLWEIMNYLRDNY